jgi:hypothetical protein
METIAEPGGWSDTLVGIVIRHKFEDIKRHEPDKAKWLKSLLRHELSRGEYRAIQKDWDQTALNAEITAGNRIRPPTKPVRTKSPKRKH